MRRDEKSSGIEEKTDAAHWSAECFNVCFLYLLAFLSAKSLSLRNKATHSRRASSTNGRRLLAGALISDALRRHDT